MLCGALSSTEPQLVAQTRQCCRDDHGQPVGFSAFGQEKRLLLQQYQMILPADLFVCRCCSDRIGCNLSPRPTSADLGAQPKLLFPTPKPYRITVRTVGRLEAVSPCKRESNGRVTQYGGDGQRSQSRCVPRAKSEGRDPENDVLHCSFGPRAMQPPSLACNGTNSARQWPMTLIRSMEIRKSLPNAFHPSRPVLCVGIRTVRGWCHMSTVVDKDQGQNSGHSYPQPNGDQPVNDFGRVRHNQPTSEPISAHPDFCHSYPLWSTVQCHRGRRGPCASLCGLGWVTRSLGQFPDKIDTVPLPHPCLLDDAAPGNAQRPVDPEFSSGQLTQHQGAHTQGVVNVKQGKKRRGRFGFLTRLLSVAQSRQVLGIRFSPLH
jgi:hypothetical protein